MKLLSRFKNSKKYQLMFSSIGLVIAICFSFVAFGGFAWFSNNKEVNATGMGVNVEITPNLIIADSPEKLANMNLAGSDPFSVSLSDKSMDEMVAVTHDVANDYTTYPSGLKYVTQARSVSSSTGLVKDGYTLNYAPADNENGNFYVDYAVYIASHGKEITVSSLDVSIDSLGSIINKEIPTSEIEFTKAASIDFYVDSYTEDNYRGTLNLAGYDNVKNDLTKKESISILDDGDVVPLNTSNEYITVLFRCYFDGALLKEANKAFINTYEINKSNVSLDVMFEAKEKGI